MLATRVALHDVDDVEGFVNATLNAFEVSIETKLEPQEREELVAEGLCIMYALAERYQPRRGDHTQDGRFSGFAAAFLPKKLGDAWHRMHPEHKYVTNPATGKREWLYLKASLSLDGIRANGGARDRGEDNSLERRLLDPKKWVPIAPAAQAA